MYVALIKITNTDPTVTCILYPHVLVWLSGVFAVVHIAKMRGSFVN